MDRSPTTYHFDPFHLDTTRHELRRDAVAVALEPKAFAVLTALLAHAGELLSRDALLDEVWGHRHVTPGVVNRSIAQLRRALADDADRPRYIQTVHAVGYRFIAPVEIGQVQRPDRPDQLTPLVESSAEPADGKPLRDAPAGPSVAILPFTDLSEAEDQDYFCDGLAEEILSALTRVPGLKVASRTSSFRFRGGETDPREIGRLLNVAAILEGRVRKAGDRVRVTAQLIDAADGFHLWAESFDRRLSDIFAIQEEIARSVAHALRVSLGTADGIDFRRYAPRDMRAYEFYLRGRQLERNTTKASWDHAPRMFRRAIELDPDYAPAHAGLADSLIELLLWRLARPEEILDEARAASRRALQLAPELAEVQVAHAHVLSLDGEHDAASKAFARAIELDPQLYEAHYYYGRHSFTRGDIDRAIELLEAAHRTRPDEFQALALAAGMAYGAGLPERGEQLARLTIDSALHQIEMDPENVRAYYFAAIMQLHLGDVEGGRSNIETALALRPDDYGTLYNAACFHALAGESTRALDLLERWVDIGEGLRDWIEHDADIDSLRLLPRFRALMERLGPPSPRPSPH